MVAAAFTVMFVGFACAYSFSAFFPEMQREFSASRANVSLVFSIGGASYFILGAISGPLADRYGPRWICAFGMVLLGAGMVFAGNAPDLASVYWGFGIGIGIGVGFSYVPSVGAVQPWFVARRGFASGLAVSGIGVGTLLGPIVASVLISNFDWRTAFIVLGVTAVIVGCAAALVLENQPARRGIDVSQFAGAAAGGDRSLTLRQALRTRPFWLLTFSASALSFALFVPFVHLVPFALDHGMTATTGALIIGMVGVGSTVGRFFVGNTADKFGRLNVYSSCFVGVSLMFFFWMLSPGLWMLLVFALLFGTFYGGFVALAPAVTVDYFGTRSAGAIIGLIYSSVAVGTLLGPPFAGYVYDEFGSYNGAILAGQLAAALGAIVTLFLPATADWKARLSS